MREYVFLHGLTPFRRAGAGCARLYTTRPISIEGIRFHAHQVWSVNWLAFIFCIVLFDAQRIDPIQTSMELTQAHWAYLVAVLLLLVVMFLRKNILLLAIVGTFAVVLTYTGSPIAAVLGVFNASWVAAAELFNIFLIIALLTALLGVLRAMGADKLLVTPFQGWMTTGTTACFVLFAVTYVISLFFWPTPAVPLIGAILLPAAIRAGLPAIGGACAIAIAGQGMAMSSDYIIQVGPGLSAAAANGDAGVIADRALVMSLVAGITAIALVYRRVSTEIRDPDEALLEEWEKGAVADSSAAAPVVAHGKSIRARASAFLVLATFGGIVIYMVLGKVSDIVPATIGGDAAALVGGCAALLLVATSVIKDARTCLDEAAGHLVEGLLFAFRAMGVIIPIAGFLFLGNPALSGKILQLEPSIASPAFLFDLINSVHGLVPTNPMIMGLAFLLIGMATGLDGSGFSGLPITGALAGALAPLAGMSVDTLAAIGQIGAVWAGGGTLIAWSSLLAVAGVARVDVLELVRWLFIPVLTGVTLATVVGILLF